MSDDTIRLNLRVYKAVDPELYELLQQLDVPDGTQNRYLKHALWRGLQALDTEETSLEQIMEYLEALPELVKAVRRLLE